MMPVTVRMSSWQQGRLLCEPTLLTEIGLRETLLMAFDHDEALVNFVCRQVEETGAYELSSQSDETTTMIEKILHS
ncbi:hypothetical protein OIU34_37405 [Pararhizobium sp. BT-229]|uniref:hypothetical protein n=1 Tax=Pararhizobium sp. BT-229 TaxID=2986923 RepID=UPI0021F74CD4|nr:hypothetical protein [Pararhizobium sp. BT-229]MCV9967505.1 hypothetical protein [Pararhizobium sp. BT-229]